MKKTVSPSKSIIDAYMVLLMVVLEVLNILHAHISINLLYMA